MPCILARNSVRHHFPSYVNGARRGCADRWVTDGNKSAVRDLVWPRADTIVWLDYPLVVSLWRLGRRAFWRASAIKTETHGGPGTPSRRRQMMSAAKGVFTALRSHRGQRRTYPRMFADERNRHLTVFGLGPRDQRGAGTRALIDTQAGREMEKVDGREARPRTPDAASPLKQLQLPWCASSLKFQML